jgi:hypothetical protein
MCAQPKVVVKIESEEDMLVLQVSFLFLFFARLCGVTLAYSFLLILIINIIRFKLLVG